MFLISGASRGIGKFLFEKLTGDGEEVLGIFNKTHPASMPERHVKVDVTKEDQIQSFVQSHRTALKEINFVHCAGVNTNGFTHKLSPDSWRSVIEGNLGTAFLMVNALLPLMREQSYGRIVLIASVVPQLGVPGTSAYSSAKAGLWGLTKVIAKENAVKNVTCNCLNLGYYNIGMINEVPPDMMQTVLNTVPMKRLGDPQNIYHAVRFIVQSDYMTGAQLDINGGLI